MLLTCENHSPDDPVWLSLDDSIQVLLSMLLRHLKSRFLPHYFIPQINLLERVGEDVRSKSIAIIGSLQKHRLMATPIDMAEKFEFMKTGWHVINKLIEYAHVLSRFPSHWQIYIPRLQREVRKNKNEPAN